MRRSCTVTCPRILAAGLISLASSYQLARAEAMPQIAPEQAGDLKISKAALNAENITQFAFGPDGRLYAATTDRGIQSFQYNPVTGTLSDPKQAVDTQALGVNTILGIAFQQGTGQMYFSAADSTGLNGSIYRASENTQSGTWGGPGQINVPIVQNIPVGDHNVDNIQIVGNTLYVSIGTRTINGTSGLYSGGSIDDHGGRGMFAGGAGNTFGDSAYNGTISWIRDLTKVPNTPNAAGLFSNVGQSTIQTNSSPYTSTDPGKLTIFAAGARNPFGLALDKSGNLYFSNNYNRADTNGNGTSTTGLYADAVGPHLKDQVYDQFFKAVQGGDYGYRNANWRGVASIMPSHASPDFNPQKSITFDNLYSSSPFTSRTTTRSIRSAWGRAARRMGSRFPTIRYFRRIFAAMHSSHA